MHITNFGRGFAATVLIGCALATACGGKGSTPSPRATPSIEVATAGPSAAATATPTAASSAVPTATVAASPTNTTVPAASSSPAPTLPSDAKSPTAPPSLPPRPSTVSLTFRAANLAFDKTVVHVSAGATVIATLQNDDAGIEHNLTFSLPGLPHGETCKGPCSQTQTFKAEVAGSYFFLCTIHDMVGTFIVDP